MPRKRRPWKRFLLILCLALLALLRVERTTASLLGRTGQPSRILRLAREADGPHLHLFGWEISGASLTETPSRLREGVRRLWR
ncbi:MAG: hypothetical protein ACOY93_19135 [Bacillota bacterium]